MLRKNMSSWNYNIKWGTTFDKHSTLVTICPKQPKNFTSLHVGPVSTIQNWSRQSNLPVRTHDNASPDHRIWKLGPFTLDPHAWHCFKFVLGYHLLKHKVSPYNEEAAHKLNVHTAVTALLHKVEHPTLPVDSLFYENITLQEIVGEIKNLNSDKSLGDDGITNRMIQTADLKFTRILYEVFSMLWVHEIQPAAW